MEEPTPPSPPPSTETPEMEVSLRPACDWLFEIEQGIATLSEKREALRRQIQMETRERQALNPYGEERLSARTARQLARAEALGPEWRRAQELLRHARQHVQSARRQLRNIEVQARSQQEGAAWWRLWLWQRPRRVWRAHPLKRRLQQANVQRRAALVTLRAMRADLAKPETRSRIFKLTETFLLKEERWSQSIQSLKDTEQKVSATLSEALRLSPRLRDLGTELVSMKHLKNAALGNLPVPVEPLIIPKSTQKPGRALRIH